MTIDWLARFAAGCRARARLDAGVVDLGGGLGIRYVAGRAAADDRRVRPRRCSSGSSTPGRCTACRRRSVILEPGRSLVGRAGVTLYRVGVVKRGGERRPTSPSTAACPTTRGRSSTARATRRCSPTARTSEPAGTLRRLRQALRVGRRADRRASSCPSRAAATCSPCPAPAPTRSAMGSNYNAVPRPAAVLVARRRGTRDPPPRDGRRPARDRAHLKGGRSGRISRGSGFWEKSNSAARSPSTAAFSRTSGRGSGRPSVAGSSRCPPRKSSSMNLA